MWQTLCLLVAVAVSLTEATIASKRMTLTSEVGADGEYPDRQCWEVTVGNPFPNRAAYSVTVEIDAVSTTLHPPPRSEFVAEREGTYGLEWNGVRYDCVENVRTLQICAGNITSTAPAVLTIVHNNDATLCDPPASSINLPQFVIITWDGAFSHESFRDYFSELFERNRDIRDMCGGYPRHTLFVSNDHTDYAALSHGLHYGAEYALHTVHHYDCDLYSSDWEKQIRAGTKWAERLVPEINQREDALKPIGVRAPWLRQNAALYAAIHSSSNIVYDSSLPSLRKPIWPYLLDNGAHEDCGLGTVYKQCPVAGMYNGTWEFPINPLINSNGEAFLFDPPGTPFEIWRLLRSHLKRSYEGDRAPMMLSLHGSTFFKTDPEQKQQALRTFFLLVEHEYASRGKSVIFATMRDVINWMKSGRPSSSKEEICSFFELPKANHAPSFDREEVCDGWDNDGDGLVDEDVVNICRYRFRRSPFEEPETLTLRTCATCPFDYPTESGPNERDDGLSRSWKGWTRVRFEFRDEEDASIPFVATIEVQNPNDVPSHAWVMTTAVNHVDIDDYNGARLMSLTSSTAYRSVYNFEGLDENSRVNAGTGVKGVRIGGKLAVSALDRCLDEEHEQIRDGCWNIDVNFLRDTYQLSP